MKSVISIFEAVIELGKFVRVVNAGFQESNRNIKQPTKKTAKKFKFLLLYCKFNIG